MFSMPIVRNVYVPFCPILKHAVIIILKKWHCLHREMIFVELLPKSVLYSGHFEFHFILMFLLFKILEMSIKGYFVTSCFLQYLICIIMLDNIHQKKEHIWSFYMISFISLSINTTQRIITLNNDSLVLLFEFKLMSMGFTTQRTNN